MMFDEPLYIYIHYFQFVASKHYIDFTQRAVLGVVDLFGVPLPFYLVVVTCAL